MRKTFLLFSVACSLFLPALKAQTAFPSTTQYVYIGAAGLNSSTDPLMIYTSNDPTGNGHFNNPIAVTGTTTKINGVGVNQTDHFLYGISYPNAAAVNVATLFRIGADGVSQEVGLINAPATGNLSLINTTSGVVDVNDNYVFSAYVYKGDLLPIPYLVSDFDVYIGVIPNISTLANGSAATISTVTYHKLDISDASLQAAFQAFLTNFNYASPGNSNGGFEDLAFSPTDGRLYSYISYPDGGGNLIGRPVMINPTSWQVFPVGSAINSVPGVEMAGAMFDPTGNFYLIFTDGSYGSVDLATGSLNTLSASGLPLSGGTLRGDLASNVPVPAPLSVNLYSFKGTVASGANLLQWRSGEEKDFNMYCLEKSTDGKSFTTLASILPKGSDNNYTYADQTTNAIAYYRLKMLDNDGSYKHSSVVSLNRKAMPAETSVYPTLINDDNLFIHSNADALTVYIADLNGKIVMMQEFNGSYELHTLSLSSLNEGNYIAVVIDKATNNILAKQKISKQ